MSPFPPATEEERATSTSKEDIDCYRMMKDMGFSTDEVLDFFVALKKHNLKIVHIN